MIVAFVQARIAYKRSKHPELQNNVGENETYNLKMISVAVVLAIVMLTIILSSLYAKILLWKSLLIVFCVRSIVLFMILLTIYSNERMFLFVKNSLIPFYVDPDPEIPQVNSAPNDESPDQSPQDSLNEISTENPFVFPQSKHPTSNERVKNSSYEFPLKAINASSHQPSTLPDICV